MWNQEGKKIKKHEEHGETDRKSGVEETTPWVSKEETLIPSSTVDCCVSLEEMVRGCDHHKLGFGTPEAGASHADHTVMLPLGEGTARHWPVGKVS